MTRRSSSGVRPRPVLRREYCSAPSRKASRIRRFRSRRRAGQERHHSTLTAVAGILSSRISELEASAEARRLAEERYLDGRPVLFPDTVRAWDACLQSTRETAAGAATLAEIDSVELPASEDAAADRAAVLLDDLVEWSKATALEKLGEGERGLAIARSWLRPKLEPGATL